MKIYTIEASQKIPVSLSEAWDFLSAPENLNKITPGDLGFEIDPDYKSEKMYAGQIISYDIQPFPFYKVKWVTEITHVREPFYFVDEQRFGPYRLWHHKHFLSEIQGGVEMRDLVHYGIPYGMVGKLAHKIMIRKKLNQIFNHRKHRLTELFGTYPGS